MNDRFDQRYEKLSFVKNPIKRIYIKKSSGGISYVVIELESSKEFEIEGRSTNKIILETKPIYKDEYSDKLFNELCDNFGITVKKSDIDAVTFVNMFCSDKDAKLSETPEPLLKGKSVLL